MFKKIVSLVIVCSFISQQAGFAQMALPGTFPPMPGAEKFRPLHLRYLSLETNDTLNLLFDKGSLARQTVELKPQEDKLMKYFLIGLTLPNDVFWVNLRPDSQDRVIDPDLARTDMGKVMLAADLQLKKDTAGYTSPATIEGRQYWDRLYKKAEEIYGTAEVTIPTLARPWIVPGEIILAETSTGAYVFKAQLKVMLEQDYLKDTAADFQDARARQLNEYAAQLMRELIIPRVTREINSSKKYAGIRQVYYSLIFAQWFKLRKKASASSYTARIDSRNLAGLTSETAWSKDEYFNAYRASFKDGAYNIRENAATATGTKVRSYFSGGENFLINPAQLAGLPMDAVKMAALANGEEYAAASFDGGQVSDNDGKDSFREMLKKKRIFTLPIKASSVELSATPEEEKKIKDSIRRNKQSAQKDGGEIERVGTYSTDYIKGLPFIASDSFDRTSYDREGIPVDSQFKSSGPTTERVDQMMVNRDIAKLTAVINQLAPGLGVPKQVIHSATGKSTSYDHGTWSSDNSNTIHDWSVVFKDKTYGETKVKLVYVKHKGEWHFYFNLSFAQFLDVSSRIKGRGNKEVWVKAGDFLSADGARKGFIELVRGNQRALSYREPSMIEVKPDKNEYTVYLRDYDPVTLPLDARDKNTALVQLENGRKDGGGNEEALGQLKQLKEKLNGMTGAELDDPQKLESFVSEIADTVNGVKAWQGADEQNKIERLLLDLITETVFKKGKDSKRRYSITLGLLLYVNYEFERYTKSHMVYLQLLDKKEWAPIGKVRFFSEPPEKGGSRTRFFIEKEELKKAIDAAAEYMNRDGGTLAPEDQALVDRFLEQTWIKVKNGEEKDEYEGRERSRYSCTVDSSSVEEAAKAVDDIYQEVLRRKEKQLDPLNEKLIDILLELSNVAALEGLRSEFYSSYLETYVDFDERVDKAEPVKQKARRALVELSKTDNAFRAAIEKKRYQDLLWELEWGPLNWVPGIPRDWRIDNGFRLDSQHFAIKDLKEEIIIRKDDPGSDEFKLKLVRLLEKMIEDPGRHGFPWEAEEAIEGIAKEYESVGGVVLEEIGGVMSEEDKAEFENIVHLSNAYSVNSTNKFRGWSDSIYTDEDYLGSAGLSSVEYAVDEAEKLLLKNINDPKKKMFNRKLIKLLKRISTMSVWVGPYKGRNPGSSSAGEILVDSRRDAAGSVRSRASDVLLKVDEEAAKDGGKAKAVHLTWKEFQRLPVAFQDSFSSKFIDKEYGEVFPESRDNGFRTSLAGKVFDRKTLNELLEISHEHEDLGIPTLILFVSHTSVSRDNFLVGTLNGAVSDSVEFHMYFSKGKYLLLADTYDGAASVQGVVKNGFDKREVKEYTKKEIGKYLREAQRQKEQASASENQYAGSGLPFGPLKDGGAVVREVDAGGIPEDIRGVPVKVETFDERSFTDPEQGLLTNPPELISTENAEAGNVFGYYDLRALALLAEREGAGISRIGKRTTDTFYKSGKFYEKRETDTRFTIYMKNGKSFFVVGDTIPDDLGVKEAKDGGLSRVEEEDIERKAAVQAQFGVDPRKWAKEERARREDPDNISSKAMQDKLRTLQEDGGISDEINAISVKDRQFESTSFMDSELGVLTDPPVLISEENTVAGKVFSYLDLKALALLVEREGTGISRINRQTTDTFRKSGKFYDKRETDTRCTIYLKNGKSFFVVGSIAEGLAQAKDGGIFRRGQDPDLEAASQAAATVGSLIEEKLNLYFVHGTEPESAGALRERVKKFMPDFVKYELGPRLKSLIAVDHFAALPIDDSGTGSIRVWTYQEACLGFDVAVTEKGAFSVKAMIYSLKGGQPLLVPVPIGNKDGGEDDEEEAIYEEARNQMGLSGSGDFWWFVEQARARRGRNNRDGGKALADEGKGGIDFRALPIGIQANAAAFMAQLNSMNIPEIADLNAEWQRIEGVMRISAAPSLERIKEFLAACCRKGELKGRSADVLLCVSRMVRQDELESRETDKDVKTMLAVLSL